MGHGLAVTPEVTTAFPDIAVRRHTDEGGHPRLGLRRRPSGRWRFLADASAVLDGSLEFEQTLANIVRLAVPEVADYCVVALRAEDGTCRWAHAAHRDAAGREGLDRARDLFPLPSGSGHPLARTIRTRRAEILRVERERGNLEEGGMAGPGPLAPVSAIVVPMTAGERTLGAILFAVTAGSSRRYGSRDLELAVDVGRRAGFAIDHALLYRAAEDAARHRENLMAV
ncbi:MAG TPA: GAF domain-containing protein, partial [Vicinamibacteria bacterium]|nr:GAF domain-containing protein [Vicinamibacteria bacterium]